MCKIVFQRSLLLIFLLWGSVSLWAYAEEPPTFVLKWGSEGTGNGQFQDVQGITVDSAGNVYAGDFKTFQIQKFSDTGTFLLKWGCGT